MLALSIFKYFPLSYLFHSRLLTVSEKISWIIIYPAFLLLVTLLVDASIIRLLITFIGVMSVYEVGYLYNDFVTTEREEKPTIRCLDNDVFYRLNFQCLVFARCSLAVALSTLEFFLYGTCYLLFFSITILLTYYFHNTIRSRLNVVTYFFLVLQRYLAPIMFISNFSLFVLVVFIFPIPRALEHSCKIKYGFTKLQSFVKKPDQFRVKYYFFVVISVFVLFCFNGVNLNYLLLALYFLTYRFISYLVRNKVKRQKHSAYGE